ncbi:hypothetical protein J4Q44_G00171340, partial [Coregonus suidteri]
MTSMIISTLHRSSSCHVSNRGGSSTYMYLSTTEETTQMLPLCEDVFSHQLRPVEHLQTVLQQDHV